MVIGFREAIWFLLLPIVSTMVSVGIAGTGFNQKFASPRRLAAIIFFSIMMSLVLIEASGWEFWSSDDPWKRCFWTACFSGLWSAICSRSHATLYIGLALIAAWTAWVILPVDASWKDLHREFAFWSAWMVSGVLLSDLALRRLVEKNAAKWVYWVLVAQVGGLFLLAASAYSALASLSLGLVAATFVIACLASLRRIDHAELWIAPILFLCVQLVVATRLYSSPRPLWVYGLITFLPCIVVVVDALFFAPKSNWRRIAVAAGVCVILVALVGWHIYG